MFDLPKSQFVSAASGAQTTSDKIFAKQLAGVTVSLFSLACCGVKSPPEDYERAKIEKTWPKSEKPLSLALPYGSRGDEAPEIEIESLTAASERTVRKKARQPTFASEDVKQEHPTENTQTMNALEKWNPFRTSAQWDPIRELEEMQNRLGSLFA